MEMTSSEPTKVGGISKRPKNEGIDVGDCIDCGKPLVADSVVFILDEGFLTIDHDWQGKAVGYSLNPEGGHHVFCKECGEKRVPHRAKVPVMSANQRPRCPKCGGPSRKAYGYQRRECTACKIGWVIGSSQYYPSQK